VSSGGHERDPRLAHLRVLGGEHRTLTVEGVERLRELAGERRDPVGFQFGRRLVDHAGEPRNRPEQVALLGFGERGGGGLVGHLARLV